MVKNEMDLLIGIDVGTSGLKAVAVDERGTVVARAMREYPLHLPGPGWTEQEPEDWWAAAVSALQDITSRLNPESIAGIGLTGQMHGSVFLDVNGEVIRPAILWNDQRTVAECQEITERIGQENLTNLAGSPALTGFTAPKILWLRNHEPLNFRRLFRVILPKDYIRFRLTGVLATDVADGSGTLLLDVTDRRWSRTILDRLGLSEDILPELFESTAVTGRVTETAARLTGLPVGTPVVAGGGDQAVSAVGMGVVEEGMASVSLGTSGVVFAATDRPLVHPGGRVHTFCHAVPGKWHVMGVMLSAGGSLRWLRDRLFSEETAVAGRIGLDPYELITAQAQRVGIGAEGLLFLPYLTGERTPHADPWARSCFIGLSLNHDKAHLARAAMEGITMGLKDSLELLRELGIYGGEIRITGGGAGSPLWRQVLADAFASPLRRMELNEGAAFGAAVLAAVGVGLYGEVASACREMVRVGEPVEFSQTRAACYEQLYVLYREAYIRLKEIFPNLRQFDKK